MVMAPLAIAPPICFNLHPKVPNRLLEGGFMAKARRKAAKPKSTQADSYEHPESKLPLRPDVGTQPQFKKKKPAQRYKYDSSLSPALEWDGQNPAREEGE